MMSPEPEDLAVTAAEHDRLRAVATRVDDVDFARVDPPPDLWARIAGAVAEDAAGAAPAGPAAGADAGDLRLRSLVLAVGDEDFARVDPPADLWGRIVAAVEADGASAASLPTSTSPAEPAPVAPLVSLDEHRRRRHRRVLAAVAAAVVVVAVTGAVLVGGGSSPSDEPQLVASTELEPLEPVGGATAEVRLVRQDDHLQLELEAHDMAAAPEGQHYELWLLDPASASAQPVSLGAMSGSTTVPLPDGVDPDEYDVVDVSLQEQGQNEHSGHSLLRGTLA